MGLFSNNKKPCPICGNPTPRILPTKVEDMPICSDCDGKVDLPDGVLGGMTLELVRCRYSYRRRIYSKETAAVGNLMHSGRR